MATEGAHVPGTLHTGAAAPATATPAAGGRRGGLFGGRNRNAEVAAPTAGARGRNVALNSGARIGLAVTQVLTAIAFTVVLGGLGALQKRANQIQLLPQLVPVYTDVFQSAGQVPYPGDGHDQFGLQWWILMFEIFIFTMIFILLVFPRTLLRLKHIAMAFLVYVFVLTTLQIQSLLFFNRNTNAKLLYGQGRIRATLAGTTMGAICNALSIIFLGLLRDASEDVAYPGRGIGGGKRVGHDATVEPASGPAAV